MKKRKYSRPNSKIVGPKYEKTKAEELPGAMLLNGLQLDIKETMNDLNRLLKAEGLL